MEQNFGYPQGWMGTTEPDDISGVASFTVDGKKYKFKLESYNEFVEIGVMLRLAFEQGKRFAATAMKSHVIAGLEEAEKAHDLL